MARVSSQNSNAAPSPATGGAQNRQRKGSGRFTNLRQYVDANQPGSEQIASQVRGMGQRQAGQVGQNLQKQQSQFGQQTQNLGTQVESGFQAGQQLFQNPYEQQTQQDQSAQDAQNERLQQIQSFQQVYNPESINQQISQVDTGVAGLQGQTQGIRNLQEQAGTESGRFGLLRQTVGQPDYSMGQRRLDQLLLQATPQSQQLSQDFGQMAKGLESQVSQFGEQAQERLGGLQDTLQARSDALRTLFESGTDASGVETETGQMGIGDILQSSEDRLKTEQDLLAKNKGIRDRIYSGEFTLDDLQNIGVESGIDIYNLNLEDYIGDAPVLSDADMVKTADPEAVKRYRALQEIIGGTGDAFGGVDLENVGTYDRYGFETDQFQTDLANVAQEAQRAYSAPTEGVTGFSGGTLRFGFGDVDLARMTPEEAQQIIDVAPQMTEYVRTQEALANASGGRYSSRVPRLKSSDVVARAQKVLDSYNKKYQPGTILTPFADTFGQIS